jgi:uncharacterized membrane protein
MNDSLDKKVLNHLKSIGGSTAWMMRFAIGEDRPTISKCLQRLKRKGLVAAVGSYWKATSNG